MLEKEDLKQFEIIINTALDSKLDEKLGPISQRLDSLELEIRDIKEILNRFSRMESEDIKAAYNDIEVMKKRITDLENIVRQMQKA